MNSKTTMNIPVKTGIQSNKLRYNYWTPAFAGVSRVVVGMFLILFASPAFAQGACIVCPPGYDCSNGTPVLSGSAGQVLARTESDVMWKSLAAGDVGVVPAGRTIAGLSLDDNITAAQLKSALGL